MSKRALKAIFGGMIGVSSGEEPSFWESVWYVGIVFPTLVVRRLMDQFLLNFGITKEPIWPPRKDQTKKIVTDGQPVSKISHELNEFAN